MEQSSGDFLQDGYIYDESTYQLQVDMVRQIVARPKEDPWEKYEDFVVRKTLDRMRWMGLDMGDPATNVKEVAHYRYRPSPSEEDFQRHLMDSAEFFKNMDKTGYGEIRWQDPEPVKFKGSEYYRMVEGLQPLKKAETFEQMIQAQFLKDYQRKLQDEMGITSVRQGSIDRGAMVHKQKLQEYEQRTRESEPEYRSRRDARRIAYTKLQYQYNGPSLSCHPDSWKDRALLSEQERLYLESEWRDLYCGNSAPGMGESVGQPAGLPGHR